MTGGRRAIAAAGRIAFVVVVLGFAVWAFRDDWPSVLMSVRSTPWWASVAAVVLMATGVLLSIPLWRTVTSALGMPMPWRTAAAVLLIGQLGKYIPGSVWTVAVQARLLHRRRIPVRHSVAAGLLYIGVYLAMAVALGALVLLVLDDPWGVPAWVSVVAAVGCLAAVTPPVLRLVARVVGGRDAELRLPWRSTAIIVATMTASWACWVAAPLVLSPSWDPAAAVAIAAAMLLGYAAGLVVVIAPAGLGVREAVFVALVAPVLGVAEALSLALLSRVAGLLADVVLAGIAWLATRTDRAPSPTAE